MIDVVESISSGDLHDYRRMLRKLATLAASTTFSAMSTKRTAWPPSRSPFDVKKVRKLAEHPTDASLPDFVHSK